MAARAKEHGLLVLMSNHNKPSGGWNSGGCTAIWTPDGQYHAAGAKEDALVMAERDGDGWKVAVEVVAL
jgi:predicted amidohydrolase